MSDFSIMCREAIRDAGLSVYKISKNAKLDRTTLQKMVSGEKLPGYSFFYRFMDQLKLNAEQQKRFLNVFQIEKDGFAHCSNRKKLAEIIGSLGKRREFLDEPYFEGGVAVRTPRRINGSFIRSYTGA